MRSGIWTAKHWLALVAIAWAVGALLVACGDTNVFVGGSTVTQTTGTQGINASPSPGDGLIGSVTIAEFGESCPSGGSPAESAPRQVRVNCTSDVTCNPRGADGKVLFDTKVTGVSPESFAAVSGSAGKFSQDDDNRFNGTVVGLSPGTLVLVCKVKGVSSEPWSIEVVP